MKNIIFFIFGLIVLSGISCQDVTIGYLLVDDASYNPDSLVVRKVLDDDPGDPNPDYQMYLDMGLSPEDISNMGIPERLNAGEDYYRSRWGFPWVSVPIEGIDGTAPIYVTIKDINSPTGSDTSALASVLSVRGDGTFVVPLKHDIPVGRYVISLTFSNEGYSKDLDDCFTIIVE